MIKIHRSHANEPFETYIRVPAPYGMDIVLYQRIWKNTHDTMIYCFQDHLGRINKVNNK